MTAGTSARYSDPVKASEHRDPSPSAPMPQRSYSSEDETPFDQKPKSNASNTGRQQETMRTYDEGEEEEDLEDGELPALKLKPARVQIVNDQPKTTRPLSPPGGAGVTSQAGPGKEQQRTFWGQLDADPEERERPSYEEDGPDDEMAARHANRAQEVDSASREGDDMDLRSKDVDVDMDDSVMSTHYTYDTGVSREELETNFCGQTLTAIGDICGTGSSYKPSESPPRSIQNKPLPNIKPKRVMPTLEEHTAIEVEFVEPSGALTPQKKNAYLTAMAKKAKDDFQKKKEKSKLDKVDPEEPQEDIYNTFSAAEKRMFLKFINTGVSASDASQRITEERKQKEHNEKERMEEKEANVDVPASPTRKNRLSGLAFWKKDKDAKPKSPPSKSTPASPSKSENSAKESAPKATESVKGKEAPKATESVKGKETAAVASSIEERMPREEKQPAAVAVASPAKETVVVHSLSPKPTAPVNEAKTSPAAASKWSISPKPSQPAKAQKASPKPSPPVEAQNSPAASSPSPKPSTPAKGGTSALAVTTGDFSPPEPDSDEDDGEYPRSGINYYDAVRRHTEDEAEQYEAAASPKSSNSSRPVSGRNGTARATKFAALRESRSKSAPRGRESEDQQSPPARPPLSAPARGNNGKQPDSSFSSTPATKADSVQRNIFPDNDSEVNLQMSTPYGASVPDVDEQPRSSPRTVKTLVSPETRGVNNNATPREADGAALERIEQELLRPPKLSEAFIADRSGDVPPLPTNKRYQSPEGDQTKPSSTGESSQDDRAPIGKIATTSGPAAHISRAVDSSMSSIDGRPNSDPAIESASNSAIDEPPNSSPATPRGLSPMRDSTPNAATSTQNLESNVTHASNSQTEPASRPEENQRIEDQGMDVDIDVDAYLNSTDAYSVVSGGHDTMSVFTTGTSATQSSRVRRPGAARARLAKAKQAEQVNKKGWHESIRAAAVSTDRVWDPKLGWVDYEEPDEHMVDSNNEKFHVDLNKNALRRPKKDEGESHIVNTGGTSVPLPFPKEWERERDEMLLPAVDENVAQGPVVAETQTNAADELNSVAMKSEASPSKPKGWVESMRAASKALGTDGQKWDPEHGWTSTDERASQTPDVVDFDAPMTQTASQPSSQPALLPVTQPVEPYNTSHTEDLPEGAHFEPPPVAEPAVPTDPDGYYGSADQSMKAPPIPADPDAYYGAADQSIFREPRALAIPLPPQNTDRKLNQWMEKSENAPKNRSELSTESSDKAVASAGTATPAEKYMQLGDNGSVRSQYQDAKSLGQAPGPIGGLDTKSSGQAPIPTSGSDTKYLGQPPRPTGGPSFRLPVVTPKMETLETHEPSESEDDEAPLLQSSGSFPSMTDFSPTVGIVREKVSQEDMGLFPQESRERPVGIVREKVSQEDIGLFPASPSGSVSQSPSRRGAGPVDLDELEERGAGPVDLDEVDEIWASDDMQRSSEGWDANAYPVIESAKSEESLYTGSANSSLPTKPVPKLRSSKKDTSPIRGRKSKSKSKKSDAPAAMRGESPGDDAPPGGTTSEDQTKSTTSPMSPMSYSSPDNDSFASTGKTRELDSLPSAGKTLDSPGVKARREQWESRVVDVVSPTEVEKNPGANAEWKSFLGKKVRAESAAAARQQGATGAREEFKEDLMEAKQPEVDKSNRKTHVDSAATFVSAGGGEHLVETQEEDDSLFEFASNAAGERSTRVSREREQQRSTSLERSELSPIRPKREDSDSDDEPVSEAYGPEEGERMSFLKRLTECAAPMMPSSTRTPTNSDAMPTAHLAFLRTNPQGSGTKQGSSRSFVPPGLCGRPDIIDEDEDAEESVHTEDRKAGGQNLSHLTDLNEKPRSRSTPRGGGSRGGGSRAGTSSVISDDVGSKTAFFEAIAMKAAVSNPRRSESRRRDRSTGASSVVSGSSQHSEKWKAFLDRKNASGSSPGASPLKSRPESRASSSTEVSKAAEKYAAGKVEEMMAAMAARSKVASPTGKEPDVSMDWPSVNTSGDSIKYGGEQSKTNKSDSVSKAAEDLAAARVEAMMASLSSSHLDNSEEGEI